MAEKEGEKEKPKKLQIKKRGKTKGTTLRLFQKVIIKKKKRRFEKRFNELKIRRLNIGFIEELKEITS